MLDTIVAMDAGIDQDEVSWDTKDKIEVLRKNRAKRIQPDKIVKNTIWNTFSMRTIE
jgi:hypothetical protein